MTELEHDRKVGFVGLSHLGIVSSVCWASLGWQVVGTDLDAGNVSSLDEGRLPIHEPGLSELLAANRDRVKFTAEFSSLSDCGIVCISLDTETDAGNHSDISRLEQLIDAAIPWLSPKTTLVLMSQVPVGFTRRLKATIEAKRPDLAYALYYWVETLVIGNAVERCLTPERIILGCGSSGEELTTCLDSAISRFNCPVMKNSYESAEMTKAAINLYLSLSVTYANVLADLCEASGASMREIIPALRLDRRIGEYAYIQPSLGISGGNLERDLAHLQKLAVDLNRDSGLLDYNERRYRWLHRQLDCHVFSAVTKPKLAMWGLAYKKNTQSVKNSFAVRVLQDLHGRAEFRVYDPAAVLPRELEPVVACKDRYETLGDSDCLLVLADWDEFAENDWAAIGDTMRGRVVIDCVNILDRQEAVSHE